MSTGAETVRERVRRSEAAGGALKDCQQGKDTDGSAFQVRRSGRATEGDSSAGAVRRRDSN